MVFRRFLRALFRSTLVALVLFSIAWAVGFVGVHHSVFYALCVAVYSYMFWAYSALGMLLTGLLLYVVGSTANYVPPPIAVIALRSEQMRLDILLSAIHCLATGAANAMVYLALRKLSTRSRRLLFGGAIVGSVIGVVFVLPHNVLPTSHSLEILLRYATAPSNFVFRVLDATIPVSEHTLEMPFSQVTRLIGAYVLLLAVTFGLAALAVGAFSRRRAVP